MKLTDILRAEHQIIGNALGALDGMVRAARDAAVVPAADVREFVRFCRSYTDGLHHVKEEELLFPALMEAGLPRDTGPIDCMLHEHDRGRELVRQIDQLASGVGAGDAAARAAFIKTATTLSQLLRAHIQKENEVLYEMAEQALGDERNQSLAAGLAFEQTRDRRARDVACAEALVHRWASANDSPPCLSAAQEAALAIATGR
ncbi:MAG: hemerythrin domain-containing protein [Deltaproteobacteria bacterium]|nr:hemerythrin domain-containing protein [Deltaproteobacteria bacterium]